MARLAALIPKPWVDLTRYHGVLAPNSHWRAQATPAQRDKDSQAPEAKAIQTPSERRAAMSWAQRLKRVFGIDINACMRCGGTVKIIACIEDPTVIRKSLTHLDRIESRTPTTPVPALARAPPQGPWLHCVSGTRHGG